MKFIVVEGNIGSGKTTFLKEIQQRYKNIITIDEPVNEWYKIKDEKDDTLFEKFYKDAKAYGYLFHTIHLYSEEDKIILCERSILTDKNIFVSAALELGNLNKMEGDVFNNLYDICLSATNMRVDSILYLQCPPEVSFERIKKRNRKGEENVPFEYIKLLHNKHEDWLINKESQIDFLSVELLTRSPDWMDKPVSL